MLRFASALLATLVLAPLPALACSCVPPGRVDLAQFVSRTSVIYWGRPVAHRVQGRDRIYVFEVAAAKGVLPARVELRTPVHAATCGVKFAIGRPVLVAAGRRRGALVTSSCTQLVVSSRRAEIERMLRRCRPFGKCP